MPKKPRNEFERGWTAAIEALKARTDEAYGPMDLVGTAVSDLIAGLKLPEAPKVPPALTQAGELAVEAIFKEMHEAHFGRPILIDGRDRGAIKRLKEMFGKDVELFRAVVQAYFEDQDPWMKGGGRMEGSARGWRLAFLPDRAQGYIMLGAGVPKQPEAQRQGSALAGMLKR